VRSVRVVRRPLWVGVRLERYDERPLWLTVPNRLLRPDERFLAEAAFVAAWWRAAHPTPT